MDENGVCKTLTVKHGDKVEMPEPPTKDGYTVKWETVIDTATGDATIKAVYTKNSTPGRVLHRLETVTIFGCGLYFCL